MSSVKPAIPKGTRDFGHQEMRKRNYIFQTIRDVFELYGFLPLETPAIEKLSTLTGKYGEEGDKLLFKVLNSGNFLSEVNDPALFKNADQLASFIAEKGLRYDLTVPFARYVVQNRHNIKFPYKRYQIQPVWRADRPQKGRYREFYQCDADVIGSNSMINEAELILLIKDVFEKLGINITIKINNRKILLGFAQIAGQASSLTTITVAIDKLEKIGKEKVIEEMKQRGISDKAIDILTPVFSLKGSNRDNIKQLREILTDSEDGLKGVEELEAVIDKVGDDQVEIDVSLARGLDYYTGIIIEVKANDFNIGSICGGGRYDDLTGVFGLPDVSGVGISFGAERIYDILEQSQGYPPDLLSSVDLFFANFGDKEQAYCFELLRKIRKHGISAELYPEQAKLKKQMNYANDKNVKYVALVGENEMKDNLITLKNMSSGEQQQLSPDQLITKLAY